MTNDSTSNMRTAFETWLLKDHGRYWRPGSNGEHVFGPRSPHAGEYRDRTLQLLWTVWQAASAPETKAGRCHCGRFNLPANAAAIVDDMARDHCLDECDGFPETRCTCFEDEHGPDCNEHGCCGQCKGSQVETSAPAETFREGIDRIRPELREIERQGNCPTPEQIHAYAQAHDDPDLYNSTLKASACPKCGAADNSECPCSPDDQWAAQNGGANGG